MEITKTVVIVVLSILLLLAIVIIWALSERKDGKDAVESARYQHQIEMNRYMEDLRRDVQGWQNALIREKRQSDHRARRIESLQRGEIIKTLKQVANESNRS